MAENYPIPENPVYNPHIRKIQNGDWVDADAVLNPVLEQILQNQEAHQHNKADLVDGKVPASQLPSFVDDVVEGYLYNGQFYKEAAHTTKIIPESGKIYSELSTNKTYRWSGSTYVEISKSLALGETPSSAFRGDQGKVAYVHTLNQNNPHDITPAQIGAVPTDRTVNGKPLRQNIILTANDIGATAKCTCRFVVGTSANGWTAHDCDYLCDGTDDQVEIQAAIDALPASGGEVVILEGSYNLTSMIVINTNDVALTGSGASTKLIRDSNDMGTVAGDDRCLIKVKSSFVRIQYLSINGKTDEFSIQGGYGIRLEQSSYSCVSNILSQKFYNEGIYLKECNNCNVQNCFFPSFYPQYGNNIRIETGEKCSITGNILLAGCYGVIFSSVNDSIVSNNICNTILISNSNRNLISNNLILDTEQQAHSIVLSYNNNNYNLVIGNMMYGINYRSDGGTGNTFVNNKSN